VAKNHLKIITFTTGDKIYLIMLFDTHCHLNFKIFSGQKEAVINRALSAGVNYLLAPGSNLSTSQRAVDLSQKYQNIFAAVGIHPHHAQSNFSLTTLKSIIQEPKVHAVGEIGLDYHQYQKTKYQNYQVNSQFKKDQIALLIKQINLAKKYQKPIIFHNREAKQDLLPILKRNWDKNFAYQTVFHCCEPDEELLAFAKKQHIFIGVDGDVTYWRKKSRFIKSVPLKMLVLETDSPYLTPEPVKQKKPFPNEPKNLKTIAEFVAKIKNVTLKELTKQTTANAFRLFNLRQK
jgi:TatD DNase family protein